MKYAEWLNEWLEYYVKPTKKERTYYVYTRQETITHRIVSIEEKDSGGYIITLEGDNKNADSEQLRQTIDTSLTDSPNYIIGKVTGQSYFLGIIVYAFKTTVGVICLIINLFFNILKIDENRDLDYQIVIENN